MKKKTEILARKLKERGFVNYTEYFISHRPYALIDNYLNCNMSKYTVSELTPKGILLGRIPSHSGNVFFEVFWTDIQRVGIFLIILFLMRIYFIIVYA